MPSSEIQSSTHRGVYYLIALSMWEYFSYYGMRALLVLYLSQSLLFSDHHAYALYGAYTSMVYVTPMLGGIVADRLFGYRCLMVVGHVVLFSMTSNLSLYVALAIIICGYGLFKSNISCVLGMLYDRKDKGRDSAFSLMYVGGNIGGFLAPIVCAYVAHEWGWHAGFGAAGCGMAIGLVIFYCGRRHFKGLETPPSKLVSQRGFVRPQGWLTFMAGTVVAAGIFTVILMQLWDGWVIALGVVVAAYMLIKLFARCDKSERKSLSLILMVMIFGLIFWAFDQQIGSSMVLFAQRNVIRHIGSFVVPAAVFPSVNSFSVLISGFAVAWLWRFLRKRGMTVSTLVKIACGMLFLTLGFLCLTLGAKVAMSHGHVNMVPLVAGLMLMGLAELFVDPIALAEITRLNPANSVGFLAGAYLLLTGSVANFLAAKIATFSSVKENAEHMVNLVSAAAHYHQVFLGITVVSLCATGLLLLVAFFVRFLVR
jgi:POT family proton-dependent oligopeptide transporter